MIRIAVLGTSLPSATPEDLERLGREAHRPAFARDLADELGASELVLLKTCNRFEVIYAREEGLLPGEADREALASSLQCPDFAERLHFHVDFEALHYLLRVSASLESLALGEDQILAQLREAYQTAEQEGLVGSLLKPVFLEALKIGKRVRTQTDLSRHPVSVASLAMDELAHQSELQSSTDASFKVGVVGAGKMGVLLARSAVERGMRVAWVANRSPERANTLAEELQTKTLAWADFRTQGQGVDAVLCATGSPDLVLSHSDCRAFAERSNSEAFFAVDVAMPRDVEVLESPNGADLGGQNCQNDKSRQIVVIGLDALQEKSNQNRALREAAAERALEMIEERVLRWRNSHGKKSQAALQQRISDLQQKSGEVWKRELGVLHCAIGLDSEQAQTLERWAQRTLGKLNHLSFGELKRLADELAEASKAKDSQLES